MFIARSAWSVVTVLVGPFALIGLVIAAVLVWTNAGKSDPDDPATLARVGRATFSDDGNKVRATLDLPDTHASTALVIRNAAGTERATVILHRNGTLGLESAGASTGGFVAGLDPDGSMILGAVNDRTSFELRVSRDGGTDLIVRNAANFPVYGVRVTPQGDVIPHEGAERPRSQPAP